MVIPSINCSDFQEATFQIRKAEGFFANRPLGLRKISSVEKNWIHIDVSDEKFTPVASWGNPAEFISLGTKLNTEVHLMVERPDRVAEDWLRAGAKRLVVHIQAMNDSDIFLKMAKKYNADIMLSLDPTQGVEKITPHINRFEYFQVLTVSPGLSGQKEQSGWVEKIRALREALPTAIIEVDGGMSPKNARLVRDAGADILVSGHYIFGNTDPMSAYKRLRDSFENSK